jgi:hypothetical protein
MKQDKLVAKKLRQNLLMMLKIHSMWFYLSAFPSFVLIISYGSCVTFQGMNPIADFTYSQVLFILIIPGLVKPKLLKRRGYIKYYAWIAAINALIQLGAFTVHAIGLLNNGAILNHFTNCFRVDYGGVYYTIVANLGGFIGLTIQFIMVKKLLKLYPAKTAAPTTAG